MLWLLLLVYPELDSGLCAVYNRIIDFLGISVFSCDKAALCTFPSISLLSVLTSVRMSVWHTFSQCFCHRIIMKCAGVIAINYDHTKNARRVILLSFNESYAVVDHKVCAQFIIRCASQSMDAITYDWHSTPENIDNVDWRPTIIKKCVLSYRIITQSLHDQLLSSCFNKGLDVIHTSSWNEVI